MSDTMIRVENLGKRYQLGARSTARSRYRSLAEELTTGAKQLFRRGDTRKSTEEFWALRDVSFEVKQGEVVGIIGRNGAGKSTLLKILSRITEPTTGKITLKGRVASLLEVGTGFHPELTGRENIFLNGAVLGMSRAEIKAKFSEIVAFAEVEKFLDTPVKRYSSGMYVRLAFAVAAHLEPEILIVDEVLAVGDVEFQKKCLGKMRNVSRGGRTVLFVSHNMGAVASLCSRGIVLADGSTVFVGDASSAVTQYVKQVQTTKSHRLALDASGFGIVHAEIGRQAADASAAEPTFSSGDLVTLKFECVFPDSSTLNFGFTIVSDERDLPALSASSLDAGVQLPAGQLAISVKVPVERLPTGSYHVEAALWDASRGYVQAEHLAFFNVINSEFNQTGLRPRAPALLATRWQIETAVRYAAPSG